jgi:hypothetical protein
MSEVPPPGKYQVPQPEWVIKGNRVKCTYCGLPLKTKAKYIDHFMKRHMNPDGTWREANRNFDAQPDYQALAEADAAEEEAILADKLGRSPRRSDWRDNLDS